MGGGKEQRGSCRAGSGLYRSLHPHCRLYSFSKWRDLGVPTSGRLYRSLRPHCRLYSFSKWRDLLCRPGSCTGHFALAAGYTLSQNDVTWVCRPAGGCELSGRRDAPRRAWQQTNVRFSVYDTVAHSHPAHCAPATAASASLRRGRRGRRERCGRLTRLGRAAACKSPGRLG